jgi:hypothetical protein
MSVFRSPRLKKIVPFIPIFISPFILFSQTLFSGKSLYWGTPVLQFIPWRAFAWKNLAEGTLPLWNPLNGMGAPLVANYQLALFYPPGWIVYLFAFLGDNPWMAWSHTLLVVLHLAWAGIGMALLARQIGLGLLGQMISGLSFSLSGYFVARCGFFSMIWAGAWMPWVILTACSIAVPYKVGIKPLLNRFLPFTLLLCISMQLLSGHAQLTWYTLLLAFGWVFYGGYINNGMKGAFKASGTYIITVLLAALVTSIQLVPTFEYLRQSQRSSAVDFETTMTYSFWPWRFLTLLAPDLFGNPGWGDYWGYATYWEDAIYIGVIPFFLAISTFSFLSEKNSTLTEAPKLKSLFFFLWTLIFITCFLALGKNTPIFPFLYRYIPSFEMFQAPSRIMIWLIFAISLLAGIGSERWHAPTGKSLYWFRLATAGAFAVTLGAFVAWLSLGGIKVTFIRSTAMAGLWALSGGLLTLWMPPKKSHSRFCFWTSLVIIIVAVDLIIAGWSLNPDINSDFYSKNNPAITPVKEMVGESRLYLDQADEYLYKFHRFFRFQDYKPIEAQENLAYISLPNFNLIGDFSSANNFDPMLPARYVFWMKNLKNNPSNELDDWLQLMDVGLVEKFDITQPFGVQYIQKATYGKFYWANCPIIVKNEFEAWNKLITKLEMRVLDDKINWVIIEDSTLQESRYCDQVYSPVIQLIENKGDHSSYAINTDLSGWFILQDVWYPGWQAKIDGVIVPIYHANYLFRGVYVLEGKHTLSFDYRPTWFYLGCITSFASIMGCLVYYQMRKSRN